MPAVRSCGFDLAAINVAAELRSGEPWCPDLARDREVLDCRMEAFEGSLDQTWGGLLGSG